MLLSLLSYSFCEIFFLEEISQSWEIDESVAMTWNKTRFYITRGNINSKKVWS